ncbi:M20/M25/M40 family metallo-hydrolase [Candidatus Bathyarchaeota archaeon]|nr:M20/M25/M40 family metallo-hydrolase [Candidatus Bathyarchaeota archaeon]
MCSITIERRTVAGETDEQVYTEIDGLLHAAAQQATGFEYKLRTTFSRRPFEISQDHPLVSLVSAQLKGVSGKEPIHRAEAFWTDCALIDGVGVPVVMYGPHGEGLHSKEEWVDVNSIGSVASSLVAVTRAFCGSG